MYIDALVSVYVCVCEYVLVYASVGIVRVRVVCKTTILLFWSTAPSLCVGNFNGS